MLIQLFIPKFRWQVLWNHFKAIHQGEEIIDNVQNTTSNNVVPTDIMMNCDDPFSAEEVRLAVFGLKSGKAPGHDGLPIELLKCFLQTKGEIGLDALCKVMNRVFFADRFPTTWGKGIIIPLHKKESRMVPENYRGISLLPTVSKVYTKLLTGRLLDWAESNEVLCKEQYGFRPAHRTTDAVFIVQSLIEKAMGRKEKLFCCFLDLSKAFDSVSQQKLWCKLNDIGLPGKLLNSIQIMYKEARAAVLWNNEISEEFMCNIGVRQGCSLSPILFSLYVNSLLREISIDGEGVQISQQKIQGLMYADDIVLFATEAKRLQQLLNNLEIYCDRNGLLINTKKSKIMYSGKSGGKYSFKYKGGILEQVTHFKYLGVELNNKGKLVNMMEPVIKKSEKSVGHMLARVNDVAKGEMSVSILCQLFLSVISPILLYGSDMWGVCAQISRIDGILWSFCKRILGLPPHAATIGVMGEIGLLPMQMMAKMNATKFWYRLRTLQAPILTIDAYVLSKDLYKEGFCSWYGCLLDNIFSKFDLLQLLPSPDILMNLTSANLVEYYIDSWSSDLQKIQAKHGKGENKLRTYRSFKEEFTFEQYLDRVNIKKHRVALTRFRLSCHNLEIEKGVTISHG